jgi:hypothetical protein
MNQEYKLLSELATAQWNYKQYSEESEKYYWIKHGINTCISALGFDKDGSKRYDIEINNNLKGYQNMNKMTYVCIFE